MIKNRQIGTVGAGWRRTVRKGIRTIYIGYVCGFVSAACRLARFRKEVCCRGIKGKSEIVEGTIVAHIRHQNCFRAGGADQQNVNIPGVGVGKVIEGDGDFVKIAD